jgi:hypothetical protein
VTAGERGGAASGLTNVLRSATASDDLPAALRLQILTTEHWNLLSTRALSWNEAFSRATMFLSALSGAIVALALVAQVATFGAAFSTFALLILPVVLFLGLATFLRLVQINREDARWVIGMNLLRHAYLKQASWPPTVQPLAGARSFTSSSRPRECSRSSTGSSLGFSPESSE